MTRRALCRRGLEHRHRFSVNDLHVFVASGALQVAVFAGKREARPPVVVELRWNPARAAVTISADRDPVGPGELREVMLLVTAFALFGSGLEVHLF